MRSLKFITGICLVAVALTGCSKKKSAEDAAAEAEAQAAAAAPANPQINADLNAVSASVESKNYDAAVTSLITMKDVPKSAADEKAYNQRLRQTMDELRARAAADAQAAAAKQALDRAVLGR